MDAYRISSQELNAETEDRFHRLKLISWWNQERLKQSKVLVVGAGALGNELIKNLALLGVGQLLVVDLDRVENSNLSRSILFREKDCGRPKAQVAAEYAKDIFPEMRVHWLNGNVVYDVGLGVFCWADVVIGGLDNREARLAINRACYKVGKPFIDGAIEKLDGVARVFVPDGPCYECTMNSKDWELLEMRRSCSLLTRDQLLEGKVPTTPTVSSVIAGVQVQEAVKYLHGMDVLAGRGFHFFGLTCDSYLVEYSRNKDCYSHDCFDAIVPVSKSVHSVTAGQLMEQARGQLGSEAVIELNTDVLTHLRCAQCGERRAIFRSLGKVTEKEGRCSSCGQPCEPETISTFYGDEDFLDRTLFELGVPPYEILTVRNGEERVHWKFDADGKEVLGSLYQD